MSTVTIPREQILSLVHCAEDYGFYDSVLMAQFGDWLGEVTDAEIEQYASWYTSPEARERGYSEDDDQSAVERLTEWRDRYAAVKQVD